MPDRYPLTIDQLRQVEKDLAEMKTRAEEISQLMEAVYGNADPKTMRAQDVSAVIQRLQWELERDDATGAEEK